MLLNSFFKAPVPDVAPREMQKIIDELGKSSSQEECLRRAYEILVSKYQGNRLKTFTRFFTIFETDMQVLWNRKNFLHCTSINYILRVLLIKSGFFSDQDIRLVWTQVWYLSPHQYLQVKVGEKRIDIDVWAHAYGIEFGDRAHGFH